MKTASYVQRMKTANVIDTDLSPNPLFLCKAQVMASMARQVNNVNVCLHENGDVLGGSCECVAGYVIRLNSCSYLKCFDTMYNSNRIFIISPGINSSDQDVTYQLLSNQKNGACSCNKFRGHKCCNNLEDS